MDKTKYLQLLLRLLMVCCVVAITYFAYDLYRSRQEYAAGERTYAQLRSVSTPSQSETPPPQQGEATPPPTTPPLADLAALGEINPDVMGWLRLEDTVIDYPLVQGEDNSHYLTHLFTGEENKIGSLFLDYRAAPDFSDRCTAIYGHHMKDGTMFTSLTRYRAQDYYDAHPVMRLSTPGQEYELRIFAGIIGDGSREFVRFQFEDDADFLDYVDTLKASSTFQSEESVAAGDNIVALVTCTYEFYDARYVLFGTLVPV